MNVRASYDTWAYASWALPDYSLLWVLMPMQVSSQTKARLVPSPWEDRGNNESPQSVRKGNTHKSEIKTRRISGISCYNQSAYETLERDYCRERRCPEWQEIRTNNQSRGNVSSQSSLHSFTLSFLISDSGQLRVMKRSWISKSLRSTLRDPKGEHLRHL